MKNRRVIAAVLAVILVCGLALLASKPVVSRKTRVPERYLDAIKRLAGGLYSRRLPLLPIYVSVESVSADRVYFTIHYFPFGSVGMSYSAADGYNMEKPLSGM